MLTQKQIQNLKTGDPLIIHGEYIKHLCDGDIVIKCNITRGGEQTTDRKYFHPSCVSLPSEYKTVVDARDIFRNMSEGEKASVYNFLYSYFRETKKQEEMLNTLKKMGVDLTNIRPKHDPCRLFKNGDIVRYVERDGRSYVDAPPVGAKCRVIVGEDSVGMVSVEFKFSENEEPAVHDVPFYHLELITPVEELEPYYIEEETFDYEIRNANDDPDIGTSLAFHIMFQDPDESEILRVKSYYESYVYSREHAEADAKAECKRLNEEYRKEQNNG